MCKSVDDIYIKKETYAVSEWSMIFKYYSFFSSPSLAAASSPAPLIVNFNPHVFMHHYNLTNLTLTMKFQI